MTPPHRLTPTPTNRPTSSPHPHPGLRPPDAVYSEMKRKAKDAMLRSVEAEREGEAVDRPLLKNVLGIFQVRGGRSGGGRRGGAERQGGRGAG